MDELENFSKNLDELANKNYYSFEELFPLDFMKRHTKFSTFNELLDNSGFKVETQEDLESIPEEEWNSFIKTVSDFTDWQDMLNEAGARYAEKYL